MLRAMLSACVMYFYIVNQLKKVDSLLFVLVHLPLYFNVGKIECNYSCDCKRKGDEAE